MSSTAPTSAILSTRRSRPFRAFWTPGQSSRSRRFRAPCGHRATSAERASQPLSRRPQERGAGCHVGRSGARFALGSRSHAAWQQNDVKATSRSWPPQLNSLRPDVRRLDDWPPLLNLGLVKPSKRLWRLLVARRNVEPEVPQATANRRVRHRIHGCSIELGDDLLRSTLGYPKRVPDGHVKSAGQPHPLSECWAP